MSATPTLVVDSRMINSSGIGVYLKSIIPFLSREYKLKLLGNQEELRPLLDLPNTSFIAAQSPVYTLREQLELKRLVPSCDIFWSPHYNVPLLPIAARKRVVTIHDVYHLAYQHTLSLPQKVYANALIRAAAFLSARVITVSDFSKKEILKYCSIKPEAITTIHNGVDTERFMPQKQAAGKNQQDKSPYLLFVGNVKPHKNLVTLLQAFAHLLEQGFDLDLWIVGKKEGFITGDTQIEGILAGSAALRQRVVFTGYVGDDALPRLYHDAAALVFPSLYEGFGLPPLEAMAGGCPVVASSAASIPEICGDAALYFDPQDYLSLTEKLKEVLNSSTKREELINKGYSKAATYTWQAAAAQHIELFRQVMASS
jgi:glycosyltransferase involved in cell wall biosynthesis